VPIAVIGYMADGRPGWPPSWPEALQEPLEALGKVLLLLGATEEIYGQLVELASDMLVDPDFLRLRDSIARALAAVPHLEAEDIEALARIHLPETEEDEDDAQDAHRSGNRQ
jgi:hypothetical protein